MGNGTGCSDTRTNRETRGEWVTRNEGGWAGERRGLSRVCRGPVNEPGKGDGPCSDEILGRTEGGSKQLQNRVYGG